MLDKIRKEIVKQRDERLKKSECTCDYEFTVAHGLSEALRIIEKIDCDEMINRLKIKNEKV